ncbi:High-affinity choline transporter 1 [Eumeta japonica]|uniref:High-affinity choline transporter 1 n=1 Tax=Eumeta variegata TaxID=151549 RepID=A0A4C1WA65_EUMVA|nr:High-affinity choline transporter 1 [Eumeta japonica]
MYATDKVNVAVRVLAVKTVRVLRHLPADSEQRMCSVDVSHARRLLNAVTTAEIAGGSSRRQTVVYLTIETFDSYGAASSCRFQFVSESVRTQTRKNERMNADTHHARTYARTHAHIYTYPFTHLHTQQPCTCTHRYHVEIENRVGVDVPLCPQVDVFGPGVRDPVPQLLMVVHFKRYCNTYGSLAAYIVALLVRLSGGEALLGLPPLIHYPGWDEENQVQLFPFRTLAMLLSLFTLAFISWLSVVKEVAVRRYLFHSGYLSPERDYFNCVVNIPEDMGRVDEPSEAGEQLSVLGGGSGRLYGSALPPDVGGGRTNPALEPDDDLDDPNDGPAPAPAPLPPYAHPHRHTAF